MTNRAPQQPQEPRVEFDDSVHMCRMCGPFCQELHQGFFQFFDAYDNMILEVCIGCLNKAGHAWQALAERMVEAERVAEPALTNLAKLLEDIPGLDTL